ncbi:hypothetical protein RB601_004035 [Gaeumannomyces tritici]
MSSNATQIPLKPIAGPQPLPLGTNIASPSGNSYVVNEVFRYRCERDVAIGVYRATSEGTRYVIKDIWPGQFDRLVKLNKLVEHSPHVRTAVDIIPDRQMLVFPHRNLDLLSANPAAIPAAAKKGIIRDALSGLAALHDKRIIHTDIKPDNIMLDYIKHPDNSHEFRNVQITDLEDAFAIPDDAPGVTGRTYGSPYWRSPESWAKACQDVSSDIFSFGLFAIRVWIDFMVLHMKGVKDAPLFEEQMKIVMPRLLIFLGGGPGEGDIEDIKEFISMHEGTPFGDYCFDVVNGSSVCPISQWKVVAPPTPYMEPQFVDLVSRMTCMTPSRRITAREALQHPWFAD